MNRGGASRSCFTNEREPMDFIISRSFEFDAGHRVWGHESKCAHLHGHRYKAEVRFTAPQLDQLGRVIDFGVLKDLIGTWIDDHWDHNMILHPQDPFFAVLEDETRLGFLIQLLGQEHNSGLVKWPYVMPEGTNPTAENLARELFLHAGGLVMANYPEVSLHSVKLWETPNCYAIFPLDKDS